jgi:UDP-2,3-diacylglucosamine hydrolase
MPPPAGPVALLGDAHLREEDPENEAFVEFLERLPAEIGTLAILGDLFSAWVGRAELQRPHHGRVVEALRRFRRGGRAVLYVEGNHDFFLKRLFGGDPFDRLEEAALDLSLAGRRAHLAHGDLVNRRDRQYRAWRALSKSRPFFALFNLLPSGPRSRLVHRLERSLARTNLRFRRGFPYEECEIFARRRIRRGTEIIVLGHFHEEIRLDYEEGDRRGSVFVLPAWRAGHRYLRVEPGADPLFVSA